MDRASEYIFREAHSEVLKLFKLLDLYDTADIRSWIREGVDWATGRSLAYSSQDGKVSSGFTAALDNHPLYSEHILAPSSML